MTSPTAESTLLSLLHTAAGRAPSSPALLAPGRPMLDHAGCLEQCRLLGRALAARGLGPRSRVAIVLPNGPEMATAFLGVAAHAACAPLNPAYTASELRFYLEDTRAEAVVVRHGEDGPIRDVARELGLALLEVESDPAAPAGRFELRTSAPPVTSGPRLPSPDDVALILHTSGTTARPKIVPLSQRNLAASASNIARWLALQPSDRCLNVMPLFHIHGLVAALLASMAAGASVVCTPGFDERRFFEWVAAFEPSWYTAVPTIHQSVLAQGARYRELAPQHRFRLVRSSSAALPPAVFAALEQLTGAPVVEAYGMTEASHQMASNPLHGPRKPGSVGVPAGVEIALMDAAGTVLPPGATGEIVIRGPGVTAGYERNDEANAKAFHDGWFRTGDQGRFDDDGYLFIAGRLKEIVNRGGEKVSPREVDEALLEHPDVAQAAAFAAPHPTLGEDLVAAVVLRPGAAVDEPALRRFLFDRLADFKVPSAIAFVEAIPKGATGKVQRTSLYEKLAPQLQRAYVPPRDALEQSLAAVFAEVLGGERVGADDNFFALGGDSLKAARVIARVRALHGVELPVARVFSHPTVATLVVAVRAAIESSESEAGAIASEIDALSDEDVSRLLAEAEAAARTTGR